MPNGNPYVSTDECWTWLCNEAIKAARWLGLIPGDRITDNRNTRPQLLTATRPDPDGGYSLGMLSFTEDDMMPEAVSTGSGNGSPTTSPWSPRSRRPPTCWHRWPPSWTATCTHPPGRSPTPYCREMARDAVAEGRPLVVIGFDDGDPSGWQMLISIGRKLQALQLLEFPELQYRVVRGALTPKQIISFDPRLAEAPLPANEMRANDWTAATGLLQTELEALEDRPGELERLAREAIAPWRDPTLGRRVRQARLEWERDAQDALDEVMEADEELARLRQAALDALAAVRERIDANLAAAEWPEVPEVPVPVRPPGAATRDYLGRRLSDQSLKLIASKKYEFLDDDES